MRPSRDSGEAIVTIASFEIDYRQFLDADGRVAAELPTFAQDPSDLIPLYRGMVLNRTFDQRAIALQRTGQLGTYPSSLGQEAVAIGIGSAMRAEDVLVPAFRVHGTQLWRGVSLVELFLFWAGDERGSDFAGPRQDFPVSIPVGSQTPHAAGVALACKLRDDDRAVVCTLGDGATSKGDFYEALNVAGAWTLPVVYVVNNNQWAISVPRDHQTAAETLAQKAIAAGVEGLQVDGNDVIAVRAAVEEALDKARQGRGATLIEALTYRLSDHTTADDASRYRDDEVVGKHWADDPIARLRDYLVSENVWGKADEENLLTEVANEVETAVGEYLAIPPEPPEAIFDSLYDVLPKALAEQRRSLIEEAAEDG